MNILSADNIQNGLTFLAVLVALYTTFEHSRVQDYIHKEELKVQLFEKRYSAYFAMWNIRNLLCRPLDFLTRQSAATQKQSIESAFSDGPFNPNHTAKYFYYLFDPNVHTSASRLWNTLNELCDITYKCIDAINTESHPTLEMLLPDDLSAVREHLIQLSALQLNDLTTATEPYLLLLGKDAPGTRGADLPL